MKKIVAVVLKIILMVGTAFTLLVTLSAPIGVKTSTSGLVKHIINVAADQSNNTWVQGGVAALRALGVEDAVLEKLPKNLKAQTTLLDFYSFSSNYQSQGKLTASDLQLPDETEQQQAVNKLILQYVNKELSENQAEIDQGINYYKMFFYVVVGLFVLAILLMLFNKRIAIVPLLLGSIGTFGILSTAAGTVTQELQSEIYSGIKVTLGSSFTTALVLAIIIAVCWFFVAGMNKTKKKIGRHAA